MLRLERLLFPWPSGSDAREATQVFNLNRRSKRWIKPNSYLQRQVGSAIFQATHGLEFLRFYAAEMLHEVARFCSILATFNPQRGRDQIGMAGTVDLDERHESARGFHARVRARTM